MSVERCGSQGKVFVGGGWGWKRQTTTEALYVYLRPTAWLFLYRIVKHLNEENPLESSKVVLNQNKFVC